MRFSSSLRPKWLEKLNFCLQTPQIYHLELYSSIFKKFVRHLLLMTHPVTHCTQIYIKLMMDKISSSVPLSFFPC